MAGGRAVSPGGAGGPARAELGPWLGVVADPRARPRPGGIDLDPVRLALVARLVREAQAGPPDWLAAWDEAAEEAARRTVGELRAAALAAGAESRAPERLVRAATPSPDDARVIAARAGSAGIPLEAVLAATPAGTEPARAAGALEEAWLELERVVAGTCQEWAPRAAAVRAWRRPVGPLWAATAAAALAAVLVGAVIGGYLPAPDWFEPVVTWWWELPWP